MMFKPLVISCVFGREFHTLYPAPLQGVSVMFSNNPQLEGEAQKKGWIFEFVSQHELRDDVVDSSLQSKYIKFLMFLEDFPSYRQEPHILYTDHKFCLLREHIDWVATNFLQNKSVLLRRTPKLKTSLQQEIDAASRQARYLRAMPQTIHWVEKMKSLGRALEQTRIMNTGLMAYKNIAAIKPLLDEVYTTINDLRQPECQIIWACLYRKYSDYVQVIDWEQLSPRWAIPLE
jgi:hypothetical protein